MKVKDSKGKIPLAWVLRKYPFTWKNTTHYKRNVQMYNTQVYIYIYVNISIYLSIYVSIYVSMHLSIYLSSYVSFLNIYIYK